MGVTDCIDLNAILRGAWGAFATARAEIALRVPSLEIASRLGVLTEGTVVTAALRPSWLPEPTESRFRVETSRAGIVLERRIRRGMAWMLTQPLRPALRGDARITSLDEGPFVRALLMHDLANEDVRIDDDLLVGRLEVIDDGAAVATTLRRPKNGVDPPPQSLSLGLSPGDWWCDLYVIEVDIARGTLRAIDALSREGELLIGCRLKTIEFDTDIDDTVFRLDD